MKYATLAIWLLAGSMGYGYWNVTQDTPKPVTEHTEMWIEPVVPTHTAKPHAVLPIAPPVNCTPMESNFHPQRCSVGVI